MLCPCHRDHHLLHRLGVKARDVGDDAIASGDFLLGVVEIDLDTVQGGTIIRVEGDLTDLAVVVKLVMQCVNCGAFVHDVSPVCVVCE